MHDRGSQLVFRIVRFSLGGLQAATPAARSLHKRALRQAPLPGACPAAARRHNLAVALLRLQDAAGPAASPGGSLTHVMPARALAGGPTSPHATAAPAGLPEALCRLARHRPACVAPMLC